MSVQPGDIASFDPGYLELLEGHGVDVDDAGEHLMIVIAVDDKTYDMDAAFIPVGNEYVLGSGGLFWDAGLVKR